MSNSQQKQTAPLADILDEDKPLSGQKFACLSFISPETLIKKRELFFFEEFVKQWELNKSLEKYNHFLNYLAYKYKLELPDLSKDLQDFCAEEKDKLFSVFNMSDHFNTFTDANEERLDEEFGKKHQFQTSVRGLKLRGVFPTQEEAELRCKMLREVDPHHDVYVGPVGVWMPFHPEAYKTGRVEYLEKELNQLMHEKKTNEDSAKVEFDKRVRESKEKAMLDNQKKALESGNVLSQTMNANGQLVNIQDLNEPIQAVNMDDVRRQLFEGDNIVTSTTDHGLSLLGKNLKLD
jgi:hypothetical protein